ncbi:hypothetical protein [Methylobacterium sp. J-076]|uniref:hypothetical protein n=1 Tax=Methylobacterium sp. J-076 TaxID=2836655 RepID=UPI001FB87F29|nr:hypothetical protein [Methylobacterium sp. J-076]MCJ2011878.1 hypothetical protein [Methylobacterium sp. J-076]
MSQERDLGVIADVCIEANDIIQQHGTLEMLVLIRHLLFVVGRELAVQSKAGTAPDNPDDTSQA